MSLLKRFRSARPELPPRTFEAEFDCNLCGDSYESFDEAAQCCLKVEIEPVKKALSDRNCSDCSRFIPQHFTIVAGKRCLTHAAVNMGV